MDTNLSLKQWTNRQALILMALCLSIGIGGGWLIRNVRQTTQASTTTPVTAPAQGATTVTTPQAPGPADLKAMADKQAAPLLDKLKFDPKSFELLTSIGNLYYDAQQYPAAVDFYGRALQSKPSDAAVRTDMATAYWYLGNSEAAIVEFNKALTYAPTNPNTLFNLGLVKWQAKHDSAGAIADWKKLLAANPNYEGRDKVQQMLDQVQKQTSGISGGKG
jgi:cytochrome c-type biogenesis protein CcmH/NrfG